MDKTKTKLTQNEIDCIKKYKDKLIELGIPIENMLVFGSKVKGAANKWSDIDVCVISPIFGIDTHSERVLLMNIRDTINNNIEPHPMNLEDFNNKFNSLANEIRKTGISI